MKNKKIPMRMCAACRQSFPKQELIRVLRTPEGKVILDKTGRASGRGVYLCASAECLKKCIKSGALARALEVPVGSDITDALEKEING